MSFRKEEKLKVNKNQIINLLKWIGEQGGRQLHQPRIVSSTYFDNDNWGMFLDSEEGCIPRKKIRIRSYDKNNHSASSSKYEIKFSSLEGRYKTTAPISNLKKIMRIGVFDEKYGICKPRVRITYLRKYYSISGVRLTIDENIQYMRIDGKYTSPYIIKEPEIAVEIKAIDQVSAEYLQSNFPFERHRFSKYSKAINCFL